MRIYCTISIFMTDDKGIVEVQGNQREVAIDCKCQVSILFVCDAVPLGTWCLSLADN
jgi:hydrogenase maturation factor